MSQGKRILKKYQIASSGDLSAPFTSEPTLVQTFDRFMLVVNVSGTPTGTLEIQTSIDFVPSVGGDPTNPPQNPGTWYTIPFVITQPAGAPEDYIFDFTEQGLVAIRVNYGFTGGTGSMDAYIAAKES